MAPSCDICGGEANGFECDWPGEPRFEFRKKVSVGDVIRRESDLTFELVRGQLVGRPSSRRKHSARVLQVGFLGRIVIRITDGRGAFREKSIFPWKGAWILTASPCGNRVCDACMVERDPERMVICSAHWTAWEQIA